MSQTHAALEAVGGPPWPWRAATRAEPGAAEGVGEDAEALLDPGGRDTGEAAQAVEGAGRTLGEEGEEYRPPARARAVHHRLQQQRACRNDDERRAPGVAGPGRLLRAREQPPEVEPRYRALERLARHPAGECRRRRLQERRALGRAELDQPRRHDRPEVELLPAGRERRVRLPGGEMLGPRVARERALLLERAVEREADRARGRCRAPAAAGCREPERIEPAQQGVRARARRVRPGEIGGRGDRDARGALDAEGGGEAP